jgi:hypothetical protein
MNAALILLAPVLGTVPLVEGIYTNEEQVSFATERGDPPQPWTGFRMEQVGKEWVLTPVDPTGKPTGPGRALTEAEVARGHSDPTGLDLRRARPFRCWAAVPKAGTEQAQWWFRRDIAIHDQGGRAELVTDEASPQRFTLKMRSVVWPSGPNQPSLVLYVLTPEGGERAVAYSWADPGALRLGLNIRSLQASCSLDQKDATTAGAR